MILETKTLNGESVKIETLELFSNCCGVNPILEETYIDLNSMNSKNLSSIFTDEDLENNLDYVFMEGTCPKCKEKCLFTNSPNNI